MTGFVKRELPELVHELPMPLLSCSELPGIQAEVQLDDPAAFRAGQVMMVALGHAEAERVRAVRKLDPVQHLQPDPLGGPPPVVAHQGELSEVKEIELDPASTTAVNLLRCLLSELGLNPRLIAGGRDMVSADTQSSSNRRARLLIGDQAIRFREKHGNDFHFWDLGEQWQKLVDLPFVYALWLVRPEIDDPKQVADALRALRDENLADLDTLSGEATEFGRDFSRHYYRENLAFSFGGRAKEGLQIFASLCAKHALLPKRDFLLDLV